MPKEYIDREAALRAILGQPPDAHYPGWYADSIKEIPAADVVLVVRCKDCKHYTDFDAHNCKRFDFHFCNKFGNVTREMDFCSYGEVKQGRNE